MENKNLESRIKNMLLIDKNFKSETLIGVIKSDLFDLLSNYFVLDSCPIEVRLEQTKNGFAFSCDFECEKIKVLNRII